MALQVNVQGGTGAGRKQPLKAKAKDWHCDECGRWNRHYWTICPSCSGKRI